MAVVSPLIELFGLFQLTDEKLYFIFKIIHIATDILEERKKDVKSLRP
jgi:hypothetical protein